MKVIVTTSDKNRHIVPIFAYLFNKYWDNEQQVEVVGYQKPDKELPDNFTFVSLGKQTEKKEDFSNDLKKYFEKQDTWFMWMLEDCFFKNVHQDALRSLKALITDNNVGRINLSDECVKQDHFESQNPIYVNGYRVYENTQTAKYRLSTQPSIWNKQFLLQYLKPNLSVWDFETQHSINDGWRILGFNKNCAAIQHNEGVRKWNLYEYDLNGFQEETINEMKQLQLI